MHRRVLLIAGIFLGMQPLFAQVSTRLNSNWEFLRQDLGSVWQAVRPVKPANPEDFPAWTKVSLPHCFNATDAVDPDTHYYQGPGWYRTQLDIQNPYPGGRTLLHFEGAGQKTGVYIYTTKVGSHVGGYDEFTIDITDAVADFKKTETFQKEFRGKVPVEIRMDNSRDDQLIPSTLSDFNIYGGIYRYLNLVYIPAVSIDKLFASAVTDKDGKTGTITVDARFYNPLQQPLSNVTLRVLDPKGKEISKAADPDLSLRKVTIELMHPQLWSPASPQLYTVELSIGTYAYSEKIGFRHFEFIDNGPFFLNGKRFLLRGTQRHEDHAGVAAAMTEDMMRNEMIMIKEMGANFIRLGHYQQSRIILQLCDSLGIMVWEEIPWCRGGLGGTIYKEQAKRMLTNLIEQHFNHPSVIIWGLGNENDWPGDFPEFDKDKIRAFMSELNDLSHRLNPSRKTAIRRCDFCKDIVDVYSPSIWAGWYRGIYTDYKSITQTEMQKVKHFLHAEWGGDSHAGRNSEKPDELLQQAIIQNGNTGISNDTAVFATAARLSKDNDWNENYVCNLMDWHLKEQETMPWLTGTAQWVFKDFSTPVRPDNSIPYMNQKGLVERDLSKKEAYYVIQSYWATQPMVHIYGHSWPVRWGDEGQQRMIKLYSNCDEAELFVNGKSYGIKKRNSRDFPAAGLRWNVVLNKGEYTVRAVAKKGKTVVEDTIHFQYQTEKWGRPSHAVIEKIKEENGEAIVQVKLMDDKNVQCLDSTNWVRFQLAGDGQLIDNQGTAAGSRYVELSNGRAVIHIRTNKGRSVLSAKIDNVPVVFLNL